VKTKNVRRLSLVSPRLADYSRSTRAPVYLCSRRYWNDKSCAPLSTYSTNSARADKKRSINRDRLFSVFVRTTSVSVVFIYIVVVVVVVRREDITRTLVTITQSSPRAVTGYTHARYLRTWVPRLCACGDTSLYATVYNNKDDDDEKCKRSF